MVLEFEPGEVGELDGYSRVIPGRYHALLVNSDDSFSESNSFVANFEILAGTNPTEIGKSHREYMAMTPKAIKRIKKLGVAIGLITPEQATQRLTVDFTPGAGRQLVIDVIEEEYEGKTRSKIDFLGFFPVNGPEAATCPMNKEVLALMSGGPIPATASPAAPATAPATAPAADNWGSV